MDDLKKPIIELNASIENSIRFYKMLENFFAELVDMNDPKIDAIFDKYEVVVQDKYPRKEG